MNTIITTLATMTLSIGIAAADEPQLPPLKEGLWEAHTQQLMGGDKKFETTIKMCRSHDFDKSVQSKTKSTRDALQKDRQCTQSVTQTAGGYTTESHCAKDGSVTKGTMTFQGDTAYHLEMHVKSAQSDSTMVIDDHFVSACPADMKPGDTIMPDGKKVSFGSP